MRPGTGSPVISTIMIVVNNVTLEHGDGKTTSYQADDAINPTFRTFQNELAGTAWLLWLLFFLGILRPKAFQQLRHKPDHFLPGMQQLQWEHQSFFGKRKTTSCMAAWLTTDTILGSPRDPGSNKPVPKTIEELPGRRPVASCKKHWQARRVQERAEIKQTNRMGTNKQTSKQTNKQANKQTNTTQQNKTNNQTNKQQWVHESNLNSLSQDLAASYYSYCV